MDNNDILRRLRYALELNDNSMIKIFGLADLKVTREQVSNWLKKEGDLDFSACNDLNVRAPNLSPRKILITISFLLS
jgi:uncharacterized protein YehS (DUF1456 family)